MADERSNPIYLDHNATTPLCPAAAQAMAECQAQAFANPSSQHAPGRLARRLLEDAREEIAALLGARLSGPRADRLIFTSGGTEANNLALLGMEAPHERRVLLSGLEHPSVRRPAEEIARRGGTLVDLPVTSRGTVDLSGLEALLAENRPTLASLMWANNDTGVVQPLPEFVARCSAAGVAVHTDAVQAVGKLPVDFRGTGAALLTAAAHKLHGPRGIGLLLARHDAALQPLLFGGPQEFELRPGTEAVALAVGFQAALRAATAEQQSQATRLGEIQRRFEASLRQGLSNIVIHGAAAVRLPTTTSVSILGCDRRSLVMALDLAGVACSSGSACASGSEEPSPTLVAMGCSAAELESSLRFSIGVTTTVDQIDQAARRIIRICNELRGEKSR